MVKIRHPYFDLRLHDDQELESHLSTKIVERITLHEWPLSCVQRLTLEGDHFYVDLVFYNRLLNAFVLLDLKLGKLTHQDLGQMQMYVRYYDELHRTENEQPSIGIVLCSSKNDSVVKYTLPEDNQQVLAARYQLYLPTAEQLQAEVSREREAAERQLRLSRPRDGPARR